MKFNVSYNGIKQFLVQTTSSSPVNGIQGTFYFADEAAAKDFAARSVVNTKSGEAYIYELKRVARMPLPDVDWQGNGNGNGAKS